ncbi:MAG: chemotaxis response regulator protein-glutamate methylesterase [Sulfurimonas sp. RIFCSPLOWO2_12_36_12]|uniref:protein-glutamate methylesterase/protein-glutamine glutaminase n=1 Tax=Sulfurimonas sp. RIFCSPLOWO2_12_36_12 TaxID=1802253 RepID=UPI0008BC2527|nr:chemotaxis response regulator protein-glutamate methylesterase [Sulfurimonas sp. RIFCSPLOWO2_12_36_12]OHD97753.1 MAG: chemotaxis response regulator protein-glutamate methylesterase [Sulfurimonas sp. RIFCSPLOWO2_02_FULL_36_28]OHE00738.1 MAG: chemotaxis response regulator protein-glutamate methylesterase [Sulfurimonas sp. RIFCSPLOWO2_12_36_12]
MAIKVLIVDDSATARAVLSEILASEPSIEVVGTASDAYIARDKIIELKPDVICLDVEMPRMDGITFLKKLMHYMPLPVIMVSSLTQSGAKTTLEALEAGAVDFVPKLHSHIYDGKDEMRDELISKIKVASKVKVFKKELNNQIQANTTSLAQTTNKILAIGASTGGTEALKDVLIGLPRNAPGTVIVQHMPANFTAQFAQRLNSLCAMEVREARNGDSIIPGVALVAPGDYHMVVRRSGARYYVEIGNGEKVSGHRPSVDVLFNSVAKIAGANAIGVILTGMGSDGAKGLLAMKNAGARTIGQDEASCVVYGMPKVAHEIGAVEKQLPLNRVAEGILSLI